MKILSNEQLLSAYRDAEKHGEHDTQVILRKEIQKRGINAGRNRK
ncbi:MULTISPECIES: sporulation histidine kinase inhibitor Sda [Jeotgalibacillus]|nr:MULTISPECIES: sporulation histidine kinase inhibitor Sda [Jeotgalibacillus]TFE03320.1 sporulation histidine kinase inhibitor Sda [Jeotgalibacillus sp. R-1-5s-1]